MAGKKRRTIEPAEIRRGQLLEAAKACFRERGFHPTRMADIAERAGLSVGLVYRYFPGKQAVVDAIVREDMIRQRRFFQDLFAAYPDDPVAAVAHCTAELTRTIVDFDRITLMLEIAAQIIRNPDMRTCDAELREEIHTMFRSGLKGKGMKMMSDRELEARVQLLGGLVTGVGLQLALQDGDPDPILFELLEETARRILLPEGAE